MRRVCGAGGVVEQADACVEAEGEEERVLALVADVERRQVRAQPFHRVVDVLASGGLSTPDLLQPALELQAPAHGDATS